MVLIEKCDNYIINIETYPTLTENYLPIIIPPLKCCNKELSITQVEYHSDYLHVYNTITIDYICNAP